MSKRHKVAITGSSGFRAAHLIRYLQEHSAEIVEEIRCIDRRPFEGIFADSSGNILLVHHRFELSDAEKLSEVMNGVTTVFHMAKKSMECLSQNKHSCEEMLEKYICDNIDATEHVLDAMFACNVENLVYVGDAYANLPVSDNFGTSEAIHSSLPSSYLMGDYGETMARAELCVRRRCGSKLPNGKTFNAACLRPTFVYGEGDSKLTEILSSLAENNGGRFVWDVTGPSRSLHQYLYAGNLAAIMEASFRGLLTYPGKFNGEFFYCMDDTPCQRLIPFLMPLISALGYECEERAYNYNLAYAQCKLRDALFRSTSARRLLPIAIRWLFCYALGFSNRKQGLIFHESYKPVCSQEEAIRRTAAWFNENRHRLLGAAIERGTGNHDRTGRHNKRSSNANVLNELKPKHTSEDSDPKDMRTKG